MPDFTGTVSIRGEICDFDPVAKIARIYCENCSHPNEIEIELDAGGQPVFQGFACENCGHWNGPA